MRIALGLTMGFLLGTGMGAVGIAFISKVTRHSKDDSKWR